MTASLGLPAMDPPPPEDPSRCQLLGPTALIVQGIMGVFVIASLVAKRQMEKRKRPWKIWVWDVGKQLVGQAVLHTLNLLISGLIAEDQHNNPCSTYFLNILIDTTIGVAILYFALRGATHVLQHYLQMEGLKSGFYGDPPQPLYWWRQLLPYLTAVLIMKVFVLLPLVLPGISTALLRFGHAAIEYLSPSVQVIFVMAVFPLIMNVVQFCLVDQVIKAGKPDEDGEEAGYEPISNGGDIESPKPTPLLSAERLDRSSAPSPDSDLPDAMFASVSRLSDDTQREARRSLSPKTRTGMASDADTLGLRNLRK